MKPCYSLILFLMIGLLIAGCQLQSDIASPTSTVDTLRLTRISLDKTSIALSTRVAWVETQGQVLTSQAAMPTLTPTFLPTQTPSPTPTPEIPCDQVEFVRDVNLPPGSGLPPDIEFTKIWRIKNTGSCAWTETYSLVYFGGDPMEADPSVFIKQKVNPGETIDVSVFMRSPKRIGNFRGYWRLRNDQGQIIRVTNQQIGSLVIDIRTGTPDKVLLDFVEKMCTAEWSNALGRLPCPGAEGDTRGFVMRRDDVEVENGSPDDKPSLLTVPEYHPDGMIQGKYPVFTPQYGDRLLAVFGCQKNATKCDVMYQVNVERKDGSYENLANWHEVYNGNSVNVILDISFLAGEPVRFMLVAYAYSDPEGDRPLWVRPRIEGIR